LILAATLFDDAFGWPAKRKENSIQTSTESGLNDPAVREASVRGWRKCTGLPARVEQRLQLRDTNRRDARK
jgi:hypothetical protein